jgi:hypothetical protein
MNNEQKLKAAEEKLEAAQREIEAVRKAMSKPKGKPEEGEYYYIVDSWGDVERRRWDDDRPDNHLWLTGNCFKTQKEAQTHLDRQIAIGEVNQIILEERGDWEEDWGDDCQRKHKLLYNRRHSTLGYDYFSSSEIPTELLKFPVESYDRIKSRITQDQINKIWRL